MRLLLFLGVVCFSTFLYAETCMQTVMPVLKAQSNDTAVKMYIKDLEGTVLFSSKKVKGSYCYLKGWYEDRMSSRQLSSRMLAVLIIVLGASLPLIVILDQTFKNKKIWIAFIGATIVIGQGFSQTFQHEESWRNYTVAKLELEGIHRTWQKQVVDAVHQPNGIEDIKNATDQFSNSVSKIVIKETTGF